MKRQFLEVPKIPHLQRETVKLYIDDPIAFKKLTEISDRIYAEIMKDKQANARGSRPRYTATRAWQWFQRTHSHLLKKHHTIAMTHGIAAAEKFIKDLWEEAYPKQPMGRPTGYTTSAQIRAYANWLAIKEYLPTSVEEQQKKSNGAAQHTNT